MKNVAIICGGFSSEFDISVKSAKNISTNFPAGFNTYLIYLTEKGWYVEMDGARQKVNVSDLSYTLNGNTITPDIAVVYIHGNPGENGKVQAYLEMIGIPYLNSGPLASELSFDKWYCNQFLKGFGIKVAKSIYLTSPDERPTNSDIIESLGLPLFVKPCDSGSSYGIARVNNIEGLDSAVQNAFEEGDTVVLEAFLDGTEVTCGIFRGSEGIVPLPLTEIVSENEFFDYDAKYKGLSSEITPARISEELSKKVQEVSAKIYQLLNLKSIARIDFMIVNGEPFVIEVNTTPGFSDASIVPKMLLTAGIEVKQLWEEVLKAEGHL